MLSTVRAATMRGIAGHAVRVEVLVTSGLPGFTIVGLPDTSCRESRDRVRAAILSAGRAWPSGRVTVNLAPSGLRKAGAGLDLAIAVGVLLADGQLEDDVADHVASRAFLGEVGLDGVLRPVPGVVPMTACLDIEEVVVPSASAAEAAIVPGRCIRGIGDLAQLVAILAGDLPWPEPATPLRAPDPVPGPDLADVRGQPMARLALEVAAAGGHHLLLSGPPGAGKTMLAERLPALLPDLTGDEALEVTAIQSAAGEAGAGAWLRSRPPFRAPHHTASMVAMVGGGSHAMRPGEASMSHRGVLFLDEMGEFPTAVLDGLRQPLETGEIRVSRAHGSVVLPARFLLVGAMNPCPCGHGGTVRCECSDAVVGRYRRRVSGPLLDRFDLRLAVAVPDRRQLLAAGLAESTGAVVERVTAARARAAARGVPNNSRLSGQALEAHTSLADPARRLLDDALDAGRLTGRGLQRVRCVALTLDDLAGGDGRLGDDLVSLALALRAEVDRRPARLVS